MAIDNSEISLFIDKILNKLINLNENGIHITESNISSKLRCYYTLSIIEFLTT
jgi:hypothetical protein